jgi:hypothetical protein
MKGPKATREGAAGEAQPGGGAWLRLFGAKSCGSLVCERTTGVTLLGTQLRIRNGSFCPIPVIPQGRSEGLYPRRANRQCPQRVRNRETGIGRLCKSHVSFA